MSRVAAAADGASPITRADRRLVEILVALGADGCVLDERSARGSRGRAAPVLSPGQGRGRSDWAGKGSQPIGLGAIGGLLLYLIVTRAVPLAFLVTLHLTTEVVAEHLSGRPRVARRLILVVSAMTGAGSCALLYVLWQCIEFGGVTNAHVLMMVPLGAGLMVLTRLELSFIRSLTPVHDHDAPLPERFVLFLRRSSGARA